MKQGQIFHQYIWIINTLRAYKQLTLEELNQKWQEDMVADGNPLTRPSFTRHRDAIHDMFGILIECTRKTYQYYIANPHVLQNGSIEQWLFSTLTVHGVLAEVLGITNKWKFFEQLWHRNNMRGDYNTALDQRKSLKFQEKLKRILG